MSTTFEYDPKRTLVLRKSVGSLSGGTRVEFVRAVEDTVWVQWRDLLFSTDKDNLVQLRNKTRRLPGAELRLKVALLLGGGNKS